MQGTLPAAWADNGAFPALRALHLARNWQLSGSLPAAWGSNTTSMHKLEILTAQGCNLTGPLPASWAANLPLLSILDLSNNALSGQPASLAPTTCMLSFFSATQDGTHVEHSVNLLSVGHGLHGCTALAFEG